MTGWAKQKPDAPGEVSTHSGATQTRPTFSRSDLVAGLVNNLPPSPGNVKGKGKGEGPALYSGLDPIAAAKAFRDVANDIKEAIPRLEALGRSVFESGKKTAKEWAAAMKSHLGGNRLVNSSWHLFQS